LSRTSRPPTRHNRQTHAVAPRMTEPSRQFGVMLYPDQPISVLIERIHWLESLGFDQVFLPDHSANLRNRQGVWYDSWAVLAAGVLTGK
jgi:alkanesulfonate monooxygenase SsuD/methylene tetrahydromethanopterin reductase-like flavin-dependent oxidoreductase (luciferase family)